MKGHVESVLVRLRDAAESTEDFRGGVHLFI